jgi:DNA-binding NarL/FixJ family response regulator
MRTTVDIHEGWGASTGKRATANKAPLATAEEEASFAAALETLTKREHEILRLRATGLKINTIADRCFLSSISVRGHLSASLRKLGLSHVERRTERACYLLGLVDAATTREGRVDRR